MTGPVLGPIMLAILVTQARVTAQTSAVPQPTASVSKAEPEQPWPPAGVFRPGSGVTLPRLIKEVKPRYTADALRARVQGSIWIEAVVQRDGTVGEVRVTHSLDRKFGLDEEAVTSLKSWRFTPGTKDGVPVPVLVEVEMSFVLGK
jgi:TonB family protein